VKRPSVSTVRRAVLALGPAGAATFGVTAASDAASRSASPDVPACATSQLTVWWGEPAGVAAGSGYVPLRFSNTGTTTCALYGFPGVSGVGSNGARPGSSAGWDHSFTPTTVVLAPGATSHAVLRIADVYNYPTSVRGPVAAYGLRIHPPNQTASVVLPFSFDACSKTGPIYLNTRPITSGTGIPGYSQ
jgi:hypothetical protein